VPVATDLRRRRPVVSVVPVKPRAFPERASHTQVVAVAAAVQVVNQAAVLQLLVVLEVPGEVVLVELRAVETRRQVRLDLQIRVEAAAVADTATPPENLALAARVVRELSSCDTRFRPCRCQTLIRQVRHTTPVLRTPTTSLLSRRCVSRAPRPSVPQCNLKWRRHLLPAIRTLRRDPGRILVRHALPIPRLDRGRAPRHHSREEIHTSSARLQQQHLTALLTRRHPPRRFQ